ncbi:MAG: CRISPR-associated protein Cas4 [Candidatus Riflebacteria bacterium]|nr:CRISPR-associated protein Cas4 [Candidatus Riflebacteria bacterium]
MLTPSEILEYVFCPRFTFFLNVLRISQKEEKRYKVRKGRELHGRRSRKNPGYLRKRLGVVKRWTDVYLASPSLHARGIVDEVLELEDGSMAPLDYKMTFPRERPFRTHRVQLALYGLLIADAWQRPVRRGYLVYTRGGNSVCPIDLTDRDFKRVRRTIGEVIDIIANGHLPARTRFPQRCLDCCYANICV